jgi:aspartate carbamoyltransferase catalytic subunit
VDDVSGMNRVRNIKIRIFMRVENSQIEMLQKINEYIHIVMPSELQMEGCQKQ